jgi:hypothetical protein
MFLYKRNMFNDKYNYSLNGIEHEIVLNHTLKIDQQPINEKILVSNKYLIKYINDLFDYHNIEYSIISNTLLGSYIFNGINIFNSVLEVCTQDSNFIKIKKLEEEIKNDDFNIQFLEKHIIITTSFFEKMKVCIYIYPLQNEMNNDLLSYYTLDNKLITHKFYDIYPIKKNKFEEFEVSIPNKIDKVLESYSFNLNYISFTKKKNDKNKIIDDSVNEVNQKLTFKDILSNTYSIIKPLFD